MTRFADAYRMVAYKVLVSANHGPKSVLYYSCIRDWQVTRLDLHDMHMLGTTCSCSLKRRFYPGPDAQLTLCCVNQPQMCDAL